MSRLRGVFGDKGILVAYFFAAEPPQGKKRPLGGQQAEGAAWGYFFAAEPPQGKKRPLGGQQAEGAAWGYLSGLCVAGYLSVTAATHW
ncbi:hypothetical protein CAL20_17580 [Bordetella genomosp. 4]|uniref:Uncharacterized protein n=1 Tax=Bordetella genomosp. 4 TaxID=463044 RepID=A0A261TZ93_9BORD|nr:hypothetical protein CAL20_17580 [Bordetella genomosp. 4]